MWVYRRSTIVVIIMLTIIVIIVVTKTSGRYGWWKYVNYQCRWVPKDDSYIIPCYWPLNGSMYGGSASVSTTYIQNSRFGYSMFIAVRCGWSRRSRSERFSGVRGSEWRGRRKRKPRSYGKRSAAESVLLGFYCYTMILSAG